MSGAPTPIPSPEAVAALLGAEWQAWATLFAAVIAAALSGLALLHTRTHSHREHAFARLTVAIGHMYSGDEGRAKQGAIIMRALRKSRWITDDDREMVVAAIRSYRSRD